MTADQSAEALAPPAAELPARDPFCTCCTCSPAPVVEAGAEPVRATESATEVANSRADTGAAEAMISGKRSFDDVRELVRTALIARNRLDPLAQYAWCCIADLTDTEVVYGSDYGAADLKQATYSVATDGTVTLGEPVPVVRTYAPAPSDAAGDDAGAVESTAVDGLTEGRATVPGRVLEAKGTDSDGGRVFRSRIIAYGDSANGRRYPESVMRAAAPLYEGAKAYDRHRDAAELKSSTIAGIVGYYRNVEATDDGIEADLHLLPSAAHAAEALDASLSLVAEGLSPLIGVSHDVMATFRPITDQGKRLQEAVAIVRVMSADLVSDPAAGGRPVRAVAGGLDVPTDPPAAGGAAHTEESAVTLAELLAALKDASPDERAALREAFAAANPEGTEGTTEATTPAAETAPAAPATQVAEAGALPRASWIVTAMVRGKVEGAGLPAAVAESITNALPETVRESDVDSAIAAHKTMLAGFERAGLVPTASAQVTKEAHDKKTAALDAFFSGNYAEGYRSFRQAFEDITGHRPRSWDEDTARLILRESLGRYDSATRAAEALDSTSWAQVLGDSITRRMVAAYQLPGLDAWRMVVSSTPPINDFREQRIGRVGGYGVLPNVAESGPYQPLTSPGDEEATYTINKRGGLETITLEMIANDDVRVISGIPGRLGRAAAQTLYRFVFDMFADNATCTYDSTALFHTNHANTDTASALSQSTLSVARRKMIEQAAYGDSVEILGLTPRFLIVPPELEEIAFQISRSAVAIPAAIGASDQPNIHQGITPILVPYYTDANDWFAVADPNAVPTIEVGFYLGQQTPSLFTQSDPSVGSAFDSDEITYKIRHIYSGTVLDHRGMYRGQG